MASMLNESVSVVADELVGHRAGKAVAPAVPIKTQEMIAIEPGFPDPQLPDQSALRKKDVACVLPRVCSPGYVALQYRAAEPAARIVRARNRHGRNAMLWSLPEHRTQSPAARLRSLTTARAACERVRAPPLFDRSPSKPFILTCQLPFQCGMRRACRRRKIERDDAQEAIVGQLAQLERRLAEHRLARKSSSLGWLFGARERAASRSRACTSSAMSAAARPC